MLKKIERILIRVRDVAEATDFYSDVFGLKPVWRDEQEGSAGLLFPDSDAELVLSYDFHGTGSSEVQYLGDDVISAIQHDTKQGCIVIVQPFDAHMGKCAVIEDPFGHRLFILDMSKAAAELELI
jgi:catechol 2,3-dioxygenase-like lactoylglutathione lyase family enzyme